LHAQANQLGQVSLFGLELRLHPVALTFGKLIVEVISTLFDPAVTAAVHEWHCAPSWAVRQMPCDVSSLRPRSLSVWARQKSGRKGALINSVSLNFQETSAPDCLSKAIWKSEPFTEMRLGS
jgi:hypothetical protein